MNDALLQELLDAGTPPMLVVKVAAEMARLTEQAEALERRRQADRDRQKARRAANNHVTNVTSRDVADVPDAPPSLDKETSPRPPKEINLSPRVGNALARKAAGFGPPEDVDVQRWNEFCSQRKKPLSSTAYARIVNTLTEARNVGWPPGEVIARSIESGWETVFVPKEKRNGSGSGLERQRHSPSGMGPTIDAAERFLSRRGLSGAH